MNECDWDAEQETERQRDRERDWEEWMKKTKDVRMNVRSEKAEKHKEEEDKNEK